MQRCVSVIAVLIGFLVLVGCVSESGNRAAQTEYDFGSYRYVNDEFTGDTTVTFWSFFSPEGTSFDRTDVFLSYTSGSPSYVMVFDFVTSDWLFADRILYLVGDQNGNLAPSHFDRDTTALGNVRERLFVPLSDEQLTFFQTAEPIKFSLRGSGGRREVAMTGPYHRDFQEMLWRIVAAREFIDAEEPVPAELFNRFRRTD